MARITVTGAGLLREAMSAAEDRFVRAVRKAIRSASASPLEEVPLSTDPEAEAQRLAEQQRRIAAMEAPGAEMTRVYAIAGFELAEIFAEWARRQDGGEAGDIGPLNPVWRLRDRAAGELEDSAESFEQFGERVARGILRLLKEV